MKKKEKKTIGDVVTSIIAWIIVIAVCIIILLVYGWLCVLM
jgi:hypothetical protein